MIYFFDNANLQRGAAKNDDMTQKSDDKITEIVLLKMKYATASLPAIGNSHALTKNIWLKSTGRPSMQSAHR